MGMKKQHLLGMLAMMSAMSQEHNFMLEPEVITKKESKVIIPKNHKEFFYGEKSVFALNQKNADKKAKSKGYI